jgi:hypothetical protein
VPPLPAVSGVFRERDFRRFLFTFCHKSGDNEFRGNLRRRESEKHRGFRLAVVSSRIPKRDKRKILVRDIGGDRFEPESRAAELGKHGHFFRDKQLVHVFGDAYFTLDENGKCRACEKGAHCRIVPVPVLDLRPRVPVDWRALTTRDPSAIVWLKEFNEIVKYCRRRIGDLTAEEIEELRKITKEVPPASHHAKVLKGYGETLKPRALASLWHWEKSEQAPVTSMTYQPDPAPDSGVRTPRLPERDKRQVEAKTKTPTLQESREKLCENLKLVQWVPQTAPISKQVEEWIKEIIKRRS